MLFSASSNIRTNSTLEKIKFTIDDSFAKILTTDPVLGGIAMLYALAIARIPKGEVVAVRKDVFDKLIEAVRQDDWKETVPHLGIKTDAECIYFGWIDYDES